MYNTPPGTDRYFAKYEAAEAWQEAAEEEAYERIAGMTVEEMAERLWGDAAAEIFASKFDEELTAKVIDDLSTEGWQPE